MNAITLVATLALAAPSAEPAGPLFGREVTRVTVEAPAALDGEEILSNLDLAEGALLERRALRRAVKRLYLVGQLADVQVWARRDGEGVAVRLVLVPAKIVSEITVTGADQVSPELVRDSLGVSVGDRLEGVELAVLSDRVRELYGRRGFPRAEVNARTETTPGAARAALVVEITEGPPTLLHAVRIEADQPAARRALRARLDLRPGQVLDAQTLADGLIAWQRRARAHGHLEAAYRPPEISPRPDGTVELDLRLRYGPRYVLSIRGARALPASVLREEIALDPEQPLGVEALARLQGLAVSVYRRAGFPSAQVRAGIGPGPAPGTRRVVLLIDEGPRAKLRRIEVRGAEGLKPERLSDEARAYVAESYEDRTALSYVDPGDVQALLSTAPGRPRPRGGVESPMSALATVDPELVFDEASYREATSELETLYADNGYLSARVRGPLARWRDDAREVDLLLEVDEGVRTVIRALRIRGNLSIAASELLERAQVVPGDPLDLARVENGRLALLKIYADSGYAFARVFDDVRFSDDRADADVTYEVDEGPAVTLGRIIVQGHERTATPVILDRVTVREGDPFSKSALEESRQRVLSLGLFSSVSLTLVDADLPEPTKDVLIDVRETTARAFELNLGASVEDGPRSSVLVEHRNLLGLGLGARGRVKINYPRLTYFTIADPTVQENLETRFDQEYSYLDESVRDLLFTEAQALLTVEYPKVFGIPIDTAGHSSLVLLRENRSSFTLNKVGLLAGVDLRPARRLTLGSAVELEGTDFICYAGVEGRYQTCRHDERGLTRRQDNGQLGQVTLRQEAVYDRRDSPFRPHAGFLLSGITDLAFGAGVLYGETPRGPIKEITTDVYSNFFKISARASGYLPLTNTFTLALQGRAGNIYSLGNLFALDAVEHVPLYKKFFLGGSGSVRGFDEDRVFPADLAIDPDGASPGGRFFWNLRGELRFPAFREMDLGLFLDAGELVESIAALDISQFSAGGGVGARLNTPVGPIAVDLGLALKDPALELRDAASSPGELFDFENRAKVHLSIGYF